MLKIFKRLVGRLFVNPPPVAIRCQLIIAPTPTVRREWYYGKVMNLTVLPYCPSNWQVNEVDQWATVGWQETQQQKARDLLKEVMAALANAAAVVADLEKDRDALLAAFPGCDQSQKDLLTKLRSEADAKLEDVRPKEEKKKGGA